jgi:hypothetical protein
MKFLALFAQLVLGLIVLARHWKEWQSALD